MINGEIYKEKDSGDILIKVGQNYKTHVFLRDMIDIGDTKYIGTCIFKSKDLNTLEKVKLTKQEKEKLDKSLKQVFSNFISICNKHGNKND